MGELTKEQLAVAAAKADRAQAALRSVQEAGKGASMIFHALNANAITLATLAQLSAVQGHLSEAGIHMVEALALDNPVVAAPSPIQIPGR